MKNFETKKTNFKERLKSKRGSVLFIVLVVMSFMVILASAVYYSVANGRQNVVMEYSDMQAYQSATDVLEAVIDSLIDGMNSGTGGPFADFNTAIFGQHGLVKHINLDDRCTITSHPNAGCNPPANGVYGAMQLWDDSSPTPVAGNSAGIRAQLSELRNGMTPSNPVLEEHAHYIYAQESNALPGSGDISVLVYINEFGDIVIEVTIDYQGRRITTTQILGDADIQNFIPKWENIVVTDGGGLHWTWVNNDDTNEAIQAQHADNSGYNLNSDKVISGHFLHGRCFVDDAEGGWAKRAGSGNCPITGESIHTPEAPCLAPDECPPGGTCPGTGGVLTYAGAACYIGNGWWIWVHDLGGSNNNAGSVNNLNDLGMFQDYAWDGVIWEDGWCDCGEDDCWILGRKTWAGSNNNNGNNGGNNGNGTGGDCYCGNCDPNNVTCTDEWGRILDPNHPYYGAFPFAGPDGNVWYQRAAFHSSGGNNASQPGQLDHMRIRGVAATVHFDTTWAVLDKDSSRGPYRSDISANHNLVVGDAIIENPPAFNRTSQVTVGKDMYIGGGGGSGISFPGDNGQVGTSTSGRIDVFVGGSLYTFAQNASNYGNSQTTYYVLGDLHLGNAQSRWPSGGARVYVQGQVFDRNGNPIVLPNSSQATNVFPMTDAQQLTTTNQINFVLGAVNDGFQWNFSNSDASSRTRSVTWSSSKQDDWPSTGNPLDKYGIAVDAATRNRIFYINDDATVNTSSSSGADQNEVNMVIIDTGLGADAKVINLRLQPGTDGNFNWSRGASQTTRVAVLTIGDGDVVMELPSTGATYTTSHGMAVMPFNFAVDRDTAVVTGSDRWTRCPRLMELSRSSNIRGHDSLHTKSQCSGNIAGANGWNSWGCWMIGLLEFNGSGRLRSNLVETGDIKLRNHSEDRPLNMNVFLVYNGTSPTAIQIGSECFHAMSIVAPRMVFTVTVPGDNSVATFGSIFASEMRMRSQAFFIAVLPGGGIGEPPPPEDTQNPPRPRPPSQDGGVGVGAGNNLDDQTMGDYNFL